MKKFKSFLSMILCLTMLLSTLPMSVFAASNESDFSYSVLSDETIKITGYNGSDTEIVIPDTINGKRVSAIGDYVFYVSYGSTSNIVSVEVPEEVTSIGEGAFARCTSLKSIILPKTLISIGRMCFYDLGSLTINFCGSSSEWSSVTKGQSWSTYSKLTINYEFNRPIKPWYDPTFEGGNGSEDNPYQVATAEQLNYIRNNPYAHYIQIANIDIGDYSNWVPIGDTNIPFQGGYDGNNYTIYNLSITDVTNEGYFGLFGVASGNAYFNNINIVNLNVDIQNSTTSNSEGQYCHYASNSFVYAYGGSILAFSCKDANGEMSTINNCKASGSITVQGMMDCVDSNMCDITIGGITSAAGTVNDCTSNININVSGCSVCVGGIVGEYGEINNCINYGDIDCNTEDIVSNSSWDWLYCGGICGRNTYNSINKSKNYGELVAHGKNEAIVGGICGDTSSYTKISECVNKGNIIAKSKFVFSSGSGVYAGGIIANDSAIESGNVENCINYGNLTALAGDAEGDSTSSYPAHCYCGGIVAYNISGTVKNCINYGLELVGTSETGASDYTPSVGRICGYSVDKLQDNYSIDTTTLNGVTPNTYIGSDKINGASLTKEELNDKINGNDTSDPSADTFAEKILYGEDRLSLGQNIDGYIGEVVNSLVVYSSKEHNITALDITSSNTDIVEIGTIEIGVGDYITSENEHMATIPLKLKAEGTSTITITSPEGVSESVTVTVEPVSYEIKMYSEIPTLVVGKDKTIGAALQLERNGTLVEDACQYSFAVSDSNVITISNVRNENDGVYFYINGHKEGVVKLTVTETNTGAIYSALIQVNDGIITYNAEALPTYYDRDAECNGFISGMYMDEFQSVQKNDTTLSVSFNVYNTTSLVGVVDVYDENNNLINSHPIKRYDGGIVSSLYETIKEGYYLIKDVVTGDILTYKQASYSQKTELKNIDVPIGGRIEITNDINYSDACCVLNVTELTITTILTVGDTIKGLSSSEIKKIAEESSLTILKNEIGAQLPEIASEFRKKIIKSISEDARDVIVADALNIASDNALSIFESFDIDFTKLVVDSAASLGVGIAEDAFVAATAFIGATLKGMFIVADYLELSCFIMQVAIPRSEKAMKIYFDDENGCLVSNGVSIKAENGTVDLSKNNFVMHSIVLSNDDELTNVMKDSLDEVSSNYVVRNIYLERDGVISQPGQNVQVSIPVPEDYNIYECAIYWVKDDGSLEIMPTSIAGDCLVFTTDHFSYYALVDLSTRSISGIITSFGDNSNVTLRLMAGLNEVKKINSASGTYEFTGIIKGTYTLEVSKADHVTRTYEIIVSDENIVQDIKIHLLGDVNGDGRVNTIDVNRVYAHVRETNPLTGYALECANVAGSGNTVNTIDVNRIYAHVKETNLLW